MDQDGRITGVDLDDTDDLVVLEAVVATDAVDLVSGPLWDAGARGIEERAHGDDALLLVTVPRRQADEVGRVLVPDGPPPAIRPVGRPAVELRPWSTVTRIDGMVVRPPWLEAGPPAGGPEVVIDPATTFGHGNHPTTRLVLRALQRSLGSHRAETPSVLDVGCGSGVLAVTAAILGAGRVVALDTHADAVTTTTANARRNGVADRVHATTTPLAEIDGHFGLVVANLEGPVIDRVADDLVRRTAPRGRLVVSGFLTSRVDEVLDAIGRADGVTIEADEGWAALTATPRR